MKKSQRSFLWHLAIGVFAVAILIGIINTYDKGVQFSPNDELIVNQEQMIIIAESITLSGITIIEVGTYDGEELKRDYQRVYDMSVEKNYPILIEKLKQLRDEGRDYRLTMNLNKPEEKTFLVYD